MGRGDRKKVRWARNRERKKKERERRKQQASGPEKSGR
jgi:hypothetical protein